MAITHGSLFIRSCGSHLTAARAMTSKYSWRFKKTKISHRNSEKYSNSFKEQRTLLRATSCLVCQECIRLFMQKILFFMSVLLRTPNVRNVTKKVFNFVLKVQLPFNCHVFPPYRPNSRKYSKWYWTSNPYSPLIIIKAIRTITICPRVN
jgi:hypothetical protein